ncbi:3-deoxy-7-phosphoheptulonate synthase, Phe-sensitive [Gammaproteobacteria bacterium]
MIGSKISKNNCSAKTAMRYATDDLRIQSIQELISPEQLHQEYPISDQASTTIYQTRQAIHKILEGTDDRLVVVTGPCSIHDTKAAREYAGRLSKYIASLEKDLLIIMRVYFEKPRTTVGWKGLINDPYLDGSFRINEGLRFARSLLLDLAEQGVPAGTEYLDLISPQYVADLISWGAIGARTTESQVHRELASGLSCPVGFKNGTEGGLQIAIDAICSASHPHSFLSLTKAGHSAIFSTAGNPDCHLILRGGKQPNCDPASIRQAIEGLRKIGLEERLMVDCSHANSSKKPKRQKEVCQEIADQVASGNEHILGIMLESHLVEGRQDPKHGQPLTYGQSITDACLGWEDTEVLLETLASAVRSRRASKLG